MAGFNTADWLANRSATGAGQQMTRQRGLYHSPAYQAPWWTQRGGGFGYHNNQNQPSPPAPTPAAQGGPASVSSTPRLQQVWSGDQTGSQVAQLAAQARQMADPEVAMKQFRSPGQSAGQGTAMAAAPQIAQANAAAQQAMLQAPMLDHFDNRQALLQGQYQQGQEALGLFDILRQLQQTRDYEQSSLLNPLLALALGLA